MNENQQGPMENLLDGLDQHAQFLSDEELKAELEALGIDVDRFLKGARARIAQSQKADRLAWMKVANEKKRRMDASESRIESWLGKGEQAIQTAWAGFMRTAAPRHTLAFRNKTDLTIEDMARILDDYERLRLRQAGQEPPPET
jgi:hypothetical protein